MLSILFTWIVSSFIFIAFGKLFVSICSPFMKAESNVSYGFCDIFFLGFTFVGIIITILSLFIPLDGYVLLALFVVALGYSIYGCSKHGISDIYTNLVQYAKDLPVWLKFVVLFLILIFICFSLAPPVVYDTGLYHMQSIMWTERYAVVPGLGNVHGRLGFNSNYLLFASVFSFKGLFSFYVFSLQGLFVLIFSIWVTLRTVSEKSVFTKIGLVAFLVMFVTLYRSFVSSPSTDVMPNLFVAYLFLRAILDKDIIKKTPLVFWSLSFFCLTLKLSVVPICLFSLLIYIQFIREKQFKSVGLLTVLALLIMLPWFARNIVLTGYLVYPFPSIDIFNVDWKIPIALVQEEKDLVETWAKMPGVDYKYVLQTSFSEWSTHWMNLQRWGIRNNIFNLIPYYLIILSPFVMLLVAIKKQTDLFRMFTWFVALCGLIFWFALGPDPRFAYSFLLTVGLAPIMYLKLELDRPVWLNKLVLGIMILGLMYPLAYGVHFLRKYKGDSSYALYLYKAQSIDQAKTWLEFDFKSYTFDNITIYVPHSDNPYITANQCYDHELPCTPYYSNNLELRGEKMEDGFRFKK